MQSIKSHETPVHPGVQRHSPSWQIPLKYDIQISNSEEQEANHSPAIAAQGTRSSGTIQPLVALMAGTTANHVITLAMARAVGHAPTQGTGGCWEESIEAIARAIITLAVAVAVLRACLDGTIQTRETETVEQK